MNSVLLFVALAASAEAAIPLNGATFSGGPRLTIYASPLAADGTVNAPQQLLLDTGSSTLAFCDSSLANSVKALQAKYYSCNIYGSATVKEGFWGPFYEGGVHINKGTIQVTDAHYAIMTDEVAMPCQQGIDGIFGIAFKALDQATNATPTGWTSTTVGSCPRPTTDFVQPLMQYLNVKGGVEKLGIYWSGKQGDGEGQLYLDDETTSNPHYNAAQAAAIGKAKLGFKGWYDVNVQSVSYGGQQYADFTCNPMMGSPCIMDTGTPVLVIPSDAYAAISKRQTGDLSVTLEGASGGSVQLKFDVRTLLANNWVAPGGGGVMLGLPLRAFYYSVFDITDSTIEFVPMEAYANTGTLVI